MRLLVWPVSPISLQVDGEPIALDDSGLRSGAEEIARRLTEIGDSLCVPDLDRAMAFLGPGEKPDRVALVVADHPEGSATFAYDSAPLVPVLKKYLAARHGIERKVAVKTLRCDCSSIDEVCSEAEKWFAEWNGECSRIHLLMNGAEPTISTALLLTGLQLSPETTTPLTMTASGFLRPMDTIRKARASGRRRDVSTTIRFGRFGAAIELLGEEEDAGMPGYAFRALCAVLASADRRLRFDLAGARQSLTDAMRETQLPSELFDDIGHLQQGIPESSDDSGLLRELYNNALDKLGRGEYADFVLRLFNFHQSALRQIIETRGVPFERKGEYVNTSWLERAPAFAEFADRWESPGGGKGIQVADGRATGPFLMCLLEFLASTGAVLGDVLAAAKTIQKVANLRNRCFAAHDFHQVTLEDIREPFSHKWELTSAMWVLCVTATGRDPGVHPLKTSAEICERLLEIRSA